MGSDLILLCFFIIYQYKILSKKTGGMLPAKPPLYSPMRRTYIKNVKEQWDRKESQW